MTLAEAKMRADTQLEFLRDRAMAAMSEALAEIEARLAALDGAPGFEEIAELHRQSCLLISLGGTFDRAALSQGAYSLCRLLDEGEANGRWDREAVDIHAAALRLLIAPNRIGPAAQQEILHGLVRVRARAVSAA